MNITAAHYLCTIPPIWLVVVHLTAGSVVGFMACSLTIKQHVASRDHLRGTILGVGVLVLAAISTILVVTGKG